jgi:hypothetical protein
MSFISVDALVLESHNNSLLAQFDTQLRIIADRFLAFFRERSIIFAPGLGDFYTTILIELHRHSKCSFLKNLFSRQPSRMF